MKSAKLMNRLGIGLFTVLAAISLQACYMDMNECYDEYRTVCNDVVGTVCVDVVDRLCPDIQVTERVCADGNCWTDWRGRVYCDQVCEDVVKWVPGPCHDQIRTECHDEVHQECYDEVICRSAPQCWVDSDCPSNRCVDNVCAPAGNNVNPGPQPNPGGNNGGQSQSYSCDVNADCTQYGLDICVDFGEGGKSCSSTCLSDDQCKEPAKFCEFLSNDLRDAACVPNYFQCSSNDECNSGGITGMVCNDGQCKVGCRSNNDCALNGQIVGACVNSNNGSYCAI